MVIVVQKRMHRLYQSGKEETRVSAMSAGASQGSEGAGVRPGGGGGVRLPLAPRLPRPPVQPVRPALAHRAEWAASARPGRLCGHCQDPT